MAQDATPQFMEFRLKIDPATRIGYMFNAALTFFLLEDYRKSMDWVEKILEEQTDHRLDLQGWARILEIILHLERDSPSLAGARARSTLEWLRSKKHLFELERVVLNTLRTQAGHARGDWTKDWNRMLAVTDKFTGTSMIGLEEVRIWSQARLQRKSIRELLAKEAGNTANNPPTEI